MGLQDISYPSFTTLDMAKNYLRSIKKEPERYQTLSVYSSSLFRKQYSAWSLITPIA